MTTETLLEEALSHLADYGAKINKVDLDSNTYYQVRNNGIWGFSMDEADMILDGEEIIDLANTYCPIIHVKKV